MNDSKSMVGRRVRGMARCCFVGAFDSVRLWSGRFDGGGRSLWAKSSICQRQSASQHALSGILNHIYIDYRCVHSCLFDQRQQRPFNTLGFDFQMVEGELVLGVARHRDVHAHPSATQTRRHAQPPSTATHWAREPDSWLNDPVGREVLRMPPSDVSTRGVHHTHPQKETKKNLVPCAWAHGFVLHSIQ